jgi:3-phenylpropionate/cinnamic acid dioxygenase small subunit
MATAAEDREAIRDLLQHAAWLLDGEAWNDWVDLFAEGGRYEVKAYSTEIATEMLWFDLKKDELDKWMEELPTHVRDMAQRLRLVSPITIVVNGHEASALSSFALFRTTPDGETRFYAVGRYEDDLLKRDGRWRFARRTVRLQTRVLEVGTHIPF